MTVNQLIEKLKKFNPDGNAEVVEHFNENDPEYLDDICRISMEEDTDGKMLVVLHTVERPKLVVVHAVERPEGWGVKLPDGKTL